jgi:ribosomal protein S18 acetylase RimI-like enzyme
VNGLPGFRRGGAADHDAIVAHQGRAYARNHAIMGVEPMPLTADYRDVLDRYEVWLLDAPDGLAGVLILHPREHDLYIWNISVSPDHQGHGTGNRLLAAAEQRAFALGRTVLRLRTAQAMARNVNWYSRHGFTIEQVEALPDRATVHMIKTLTAEAN